MVFLAFSHNRVASKVAQKIRDDLALREVFAYRAIDDPHPGWPLQQKLDAWIQSSDGVILLWSELGSKSRAVNEEYRTAKRMGKRICLVRFSGVKEPLDWSGEEWLDLQGVSFGFFGPQFHDPSSDPQWSKFVDVLANFAREARAERRR